MVEKHQERPLPGPVTIYFVSSRLPVWSHFLKVKNVLLLLKTTTSVGIKNKTLSRVELVSGVYRERRGPPYQEWGVWSEQQKRGGAHGGGDDVSLPSIFSNPAPRGAAHYLNRVSLA